MLGDFGMKVENIGVTLGTNNRTIKKSKDQNYSYPAFRRNWSEHASWGANYIKETGKTNFKLFSFPDAKAVFVLKNISKSKYKNLFIRGL